MKAIAGAIAYRVHLANVLDSRPSLLQGSAQLFYITAIKRDPRILTTSIPILSVRAFNADFDGDELNFSLAIDNKMAKFWMPLAPHHNLFVLNAPRAVSGNNAIPKPDVATMSAWMDSDYEPVPTPEQIKAFSMLPDA